LWTKAKFLVWFDRDRFIGWGLAVFNCLCQPLTQAPQVRRTRLSLMNTHTGNHSLTCPICQHTEQLKPIKGNRGLFTCPYCQEKLVVSWSGHYVRDPHSLRQVMVAHALRRQSRPWARIIRDLGSLKRPVAVLTAGSIFLLGISIFSLDSLNKQQSPWERLVEDVKEIAN